jgi:hypothetical protein
MKITKLVLFLILVLAVTIPLGFVAAKGGPPSKEDSAGNNLSFPVIWAEGVTKTLPGTSGMTPALGGEWWYQWGTNGIDPDVTPASCPPDPDEGNTVLNPDGLLLCDDGVAGSVDLSKVAGVPTADNPLPLAKAYLQKDPQNLWQAWSGTPGDAGVAESGGEIYVDWIDWGDNLESVDWYTRSQVRTEVVLFQDLPTPQLEHEMRHTSGWGINEVHGLATDMENTPLLGPGTQATVYSPCARMTIQKLLFLREELPDGLTWSLTGDEGKPAWIGVDPYGKLIINPPIFNMAVYQAGDGPGYYNAEINVKGRIIYGYTWNVRKLNDVTGGTAAGDYRITFSFDQTCDDVSLNTFFNGETQIMVLLETEEALEAALSSTEEGEEPGGGAVAVLDTEHNLTYIDVRILDRGGGKGGGGGKPSGSNDLPFK